MESLVTLTAGIGSVVAVLRSFLDNPILAPVRSVIELFMNKMNSAQSGLQTLTDGATETASQAYQMATKAKAGFDTLGDSVINGVNGVAQDLLGIDLTGMSTATI